MTDEEDDFGYVPSWLEKPEPIYTRRGCTMYCNDQRQFDVYPNDMGDLELDELMDHIVKLLNQAAGT